MYKLTNDHYQKSRLRKRVIIYFLHPPTGMAALTVKLRNVVIVSLFGDGFKNSFIVIFASRVAWLTAFKCYATSNWFMVTSIKK